MKLLTRQEIDKAKATDRKREVDEGVKLATKVDRLRQVTSEEETNLRKFRDSSIKAVKAEIDGFIAKRDALKTEVVALEEKRMLAQAPLDLKTAWQKVKTEGIEVEAWKRDLLGRETALIARESTIEAKIKEFVDRDESLKEKEELTERYLQETRTAYQEADETRSKAETKRSEGEQELAEKQKALARAEQDLAYERREFENEKNQVERQKKANADERLHIESQQKTLRTAWEQIKRLKQ